MPDRPWTDEDQAISDQKLYFVVTIWLPAGNKRPTKHLWGPAPYHVANRRKHELANWWKAYGLSEDKGTYIVDVIRWRAAI